MADGQPQAKGNSPDLLQSQQSAPQIGVAERHDPSTQDAKFGARRAPVSTGILRWFMRAADIAIVLLITYAAMTYYGTPLFEARLGEAMPFLLIPVVAIWGVTSAGAYKLNFSRPAIDHMLRVGNASGFALMALGIVNYLILGWPYGYMPVITSMIVWTALIAFHAHYVFILKHLLRAGRLSENVVLVGATPNAQRLVERNADTREVNIVGVFDDRLSRAPKSLSGVPLLGRIDDLMNWERLPEIDRIVVTVTPEAKHRVRHLVDRLRVLPQRIVLLLDFHGFNPENESLAEIARSPAAYVSGHPEDAKRSTMKRVTDVVFASLMLIGFSPLLLVVALMIKLDSRGPVFFRQRRHGFNNQIIRVWKFRSMKDNKRAEHHMINQTVSNDPRVTAVGRIIRKTSIDELPQLWNVIKGEMSIVGPRPHAVGMAAEEIEVHEIVGDYAHRHRMKPGITGWAQINGSRGPVHTREEVRERVELDMEYINRASFWFDLYIMVMTAPCLLGDSKRER